MEKIDFNSPVEIEISTTVRKFLHSCNEQNKKPKDLTLENTNIWYELQVIGINSLNQELQKLIDNGFANQNRIIWIMYRDAIINTWNNWIYTTDDIAFPMDIRMGPRLNLRNGLLKTINMLRGRDFDLSRLKGDFK